MDIKTYAKEHHVPIMLDEGLAFLLEYVKTNNVKNILELGTAIGYSAMNMAKIAEDIHIDTIEINEVMYNEAIKNIKEAIKLNNFDPMALYSYGLYVNTVAGEIKGLDKKKITESYVNIPIHSRRDLAVTSEDILISLNKEPGKYLKEIFEDIIYQVLYRRLPNEKEVILDYIVDKYK